MHTRIQDTILYSYKFKSHAGKALIKKIFNGHVSPVNSGSLVRPITFVTFSRSNNCLQ